VVMICVFLSFSNFDTFLILFIYVFAALLFPLSVCLFSIVPV